VGHALDLEKLISAIDRPGSDRDLTNDIIHIAPDLTLEDALRVQLAVKRRCVERGDRIVGHQASFTSAVMQKLVPSMPPPMVGTLLASHVRYSGDTVELLDDDPFGIESELGILLGKDLRGPNVTTIEALAAVEAYVPAIEVAPFRPGLVEGKWSNQHLIAVQKAPGGYIVFGSQLTSVSGFDSRNEGVIVSVDGKARASAAGVEAMGGPIYVLAAIANRLAAAGEFLKAGQLVITGSLPPAQIINAREGFAEVEFTRLGRVQVRLRRRS
jgi:2-keto-4-pentenoate hydratase